MAIAIGQPVGAYNAVRLRKDSTRAPNHLSSQNGAHGYVRPVRVGGCSNAMGGLAPPQQQSTHAGTAPLPLTAGSLLHSPAATLSVRSLTDLPPGLTTVVGLAGVRDLSHQPKVVFDFDLWALVPEFGGPVVGGCDGAAMAEAPPVCPTIFSDRLFIDGDEARYVSAPPGLEGWKYETAVGRAGQRDGAAISSTDRSTSGYSQARRYVAAPPGLESSTRQPNSAMQRAGDRDTARTCGNNRRTNINWQAPRYVPTPPGLEPQATVELPQRRNAAAGAEAPAMLKHLQAPRYIAAPPGLEAYVAQRMVIRH